MRFHNQARESRYNAAKGLNSSAATQPSQTIGHHWGSIPPLAPALTKDKKKQ